MTTRKPVHRIVASVALAATLALLPVTASVAQAQGRSSGIGVPISGTATAADNTVQTLSGTFTIQRFARAHGPQGCGVLHQRRHLAVPEGHRRDE